MNISPEPWRYECPEGHVHWQYRKSGDWYCKTCGEHYPYFLDKKTGEKVTP